MMSFNSYFSPSSSDSFEVLPEKRLIFSPLLAGFSDSRGDYQRNYMLSCRRAEKIRLAFEDRGINVEKALCVGEEVPVASNKKPGRSRRKSTGGGLGEVNTDQKNRRFPNIGIRFLQGQATKEIIQRQC